jgi:hypothetical protein
MASLPALPVGDAWFWSPGWPTTDGIFQRVHVSPIETFDSGASPKAGEKRVEPKNLADVDLGSLSKQMSATIEKAKENDPKLLKTQEGARDQIERERSCRNEGEAGHRHERDRQGCRPSTRCRAQTLAADDDSSRAGSHGRLSHLAEAE